MANPVPTLQKDSLRSVRTGRTIREQTAPFESENGRGRAMDFTTGNAVPTGDVAAAVPSSKSVAPPAFPVDKDAGRDDLLTEFGM